MPTENVPRIGNFMKRNLAVLLCSIAFCSPGMSADIKNKKLYLNCKSGKDTIILSKDNESDWFKVEIPCLSWDRTIETGDDSDAVFRGRDAGMTELYIIKKDQLAGGRVNDLDGQIVSRFSRTKNKTVYAKDVYCKVNNIVDTEFKLNVLMDCELRDNEYTTVLKSE